MSRPKLDLEQQIDHMESNGIQFNIIPKKDAKDFLSQNTYYFKLKAFAKNYEKYIGGSKKGQYVNLEFAYLKELSTLDMHLRKLLSSMTADIEHYLKVKLINDIVENSLEDGYNIINQFLLKNEKISKGFASKCTYSVTSDLVKKYCNDWAIWNIIEVLSFGDFVKLYIFYYIHYTDLYKSKETYMYLLGSVRFLRNAAAHNNCLLNSISTPYLISRCPKQVCTIDEIDTSSKNRPFQMTKMLSDSVTASQTDIGISDSVRRKMLHNPVIHDLTAVVYLYSKICSSGSIKATKISIDCFIKRCAKFPNYFTTNQAIQSSFNYFKKIVDFYLNKDDTVVVEQKEKSF